MPSSTSIPIIVQGNSFAFAIPLQIYVISEGSMVLQDYTPDPTDQVSIQLKGSRRQYTYAPTIQGNTAFIDLSGNEMADNYGVVVSIVKADGTRLRSFRTDQFFIVESSDDLTPDDIIEGLENNVIYLNSQAFIAGADGRGITSIVKTSTVGLVDTYTITYSDNTTSTFTVTNGANGQAGAQGQDGVGITSIEKTATVGLVDTYTITLSNGQTSTFEVTNGQDGHDLGLAVIVDDLTTGGHEDALSAEMGKVLGEDMDALEFALTGEVKMITGHYIPTNQGIGQVCPMTITASSTNDCAVINLSAGQTLKIVGVGGNSSRLWAVLDKNTHKILSVANANSNAPAVPFTKSIIAENDCIVVVNVYNASYPNKPYYNNAGTPYSVKASSLIPQIVNNLNDGGVDKALSAEMGVELKSEVDTLGLAVHGGDVPMTKGKYIATNQGVGEVCPMVLTDSSTNDCAVINLFAGQSVNIVGVGGNSSRLWAVLDKDTHVIQSVANGNTNAPAVPFTKTITAEDDCIVVVNVYNETYPNKPYYNNAGTPYSVKASSLQPSTDFEVFEPSGADTAPATATAYHALWDNLVTSGLVERSTIATAQNEPVYLYHIGVYNKIVNNPNNDYYFDIVDNNYFGKKKIMLISGIHGYERLTPMYAYEFFNRILTDDRYAGIRSAYEFYVVPLVNPTGFNNNTRNNYNNVDINRDFLAKSQVETQAVCDLIDNNTFEMFIDMHQSGAGRSQYSPQVCGTLICPRSATAAELQEICTPYYIGGAKADASLNNYFGKNVAESCFAWTPITISANQQQSHDYAYEQGIVKSVEFEFSQYCYAFSGSDVIYNHASYVYGNTLLQYLMMQYFGNADI